MNQSEIDYTAADRGIRSSAEHAEAEVPGWGDMALTCLREFAEKCPLPFKIEVARLDAAFAGLPEPPDARAWGAVTQRAIREGVIVKTGLFAPAFTSNGAPKPLYVGCV